MIRFPFLPMLARVVLTYTVVKELDPELIHASGPLRGLIAGELFSRKRKVVISLHGLLSTQEETTPNFDKFILEKKVLELPASFIFMGSGGVAAAKRIQPSLDNSKTCVIGDLYDPDIFHLPDSKEAVRKDLGFSEKDVVLVTAATLHRLKGQRRVVQAINLLPREIRNRIRYVIIGEGPYRKTIEQEIADSGLASQVTLTGRLSQQTLAKYLQAADMVLAPSSAEGFGGPMVEAQACGAPPVASERLDAARDIIADSSHGVLTKDHSPQAIKKGVLECLSRTWDAQVLADKAQDYSGERIAERFKAFYEHIIKS